MVYSPVFTWTGGAPAPTWPWERIFQVYLRNLFLWRLGHPPRILVLSNHSESSSRCMSRLKSRLEHPLNHRQVRKWTLLWRNKSNNYISHGLSWKVPSWRISPFCMQAATTMSDLPLFPNTFEVHGQHESEHAGTQTVRARAPCLSHGPKTHSSLSSSRMERVKSPSSRRQKKENFRHDHLLVSQQPPSEISQSLPWASDLEPVRRQRDLAKSWHLHRTGTEEESMRFFVIALHSVNVPSLNL